MSVNGPVDELCVKCVIPRNFPNAKFDGNGVCNFCNEKNEARNFEFNEKQKAYFLDVLNDSRSENNYDALCCFSGGKDSTFLLSMLIQKFELNVLAFTLDNGFITGQAKRNIEAVVDKLGVDHIFLRPKKKFMTRVYTEAMFGSLNEGRGMYETRISDTCLSCITLINTQAAKLALKFNIKMIFAGFTAGQVPKAVVSNQHHFYAESFNNQKEQYKASLGEDYKAFEIEKDERQLYQMSPFLVYEFSEDEVLESIRELGWERPEELDGCTSNCALNAAGNLCHKQKYGYHPYALELSQLIRLGLLSRDEAIKKLNNNGSEENLKKTFSRLGVENPLKSKA